MSVHKKLGKLQTLTAQRATGRLQIIQGSKITTGFWLLLKPFGYKVMTIYITHGFCFQTREDSWAQLHTSKHNYYRIMTIASKALHQIKHNWGSPGYNIEHWLQAFLPLCSSIYLRSCACARDSHTCKLYAQQDLWGQFFLFWNKAETKM